jgi:hypothetical protein
VQTTLQPWSASIYHSILQQGLQPSLTFTKVPEALFLLKSSEVPSGPGSAGLVSGSNPGSAKGFSRNLADCTVSFEEARGAVAAGMLTVGYVSGTDGQLYLNPPESSRLSPRDTLVALTTQDKVAAAGGWLHVQMEGMERWGGKMGPGAFVATAGWLCFGEGVGGASWSVVWRQLLQSKIRWCWYRLHDSLLPREGLRVQQCV